MQLPVAAWLPPVGVCGIALAVLGAILSVTQFKGWKKLFFPALFLFLGAGEGASIYRAEKDHNREVGALTDSIKGLKDANDKGQKQIDDLTGKVGDLQGELSTAQGDLTQIKGSNIVTGKSPISVTVTNPNSATPATPPVMSGIRIASQKRIPSDDPNFPFALQVIVQTDVDISPVKLAIVCDGPIGRGFASFSEGGAFTMKSVGLAEGNDHVFVTKWETPSWTPQKPIVITLWSKSEIHATELSRNVN